jgi:hypothetical protein
LYHNARVSEGTMEKWLECFLYNPFITIFMTYQKDSRPHGAELILAAQRSDDPDVMVSNPTVG